jgi:hypothetical protein
MFTKDALPASSSATPNGQALAYVYFSNRPFGVKRFQTIHHYSADGARGLALLFGIGTEALPAWDSKDEVEQSLRRPDRDWQYQH